MTNLQCSVNNCASNFDDFCCRPDIKVKGKQACSSSETCCSSFQEKSDAAATNDMRFDMPNPITHVRCDAKNCKFNDTGKCDANHISIDGAGASNSIQTLCSSFITQ